MKTNAPQENENLVYVISTIPQFLLDWQDTSYQDIFLHQKPKLGHESHTLTNYDEDHQNKTYETK